MSKRKRNKNKHAEDKMQKYIAVFKYVAGHRDDSTTYYGYGFTFVQKESQAVGRCEAKAVTASNGKSRDVVAIWLAEMRNPIYTLKLYVGEGTTTGDLRIADSIIKGQIAKADDQGFASKARKKNDRAAKRALLAASIAAATVSHKASTPKPKKAETPSYWPPYYTLKQA